MPEFVCVSDYEQRAAALLGIKEKAYPNSGAEEEITMKDNIEAFKRIRLRPRMLRDVSVRDLTTSLLGHPVSMPIGIAPSDTYTIFHPDGETAIARAAQSSGCCYILSTGASRSMKEVEAAARDCLKWFQVYILQNRDLTKNNIRRAAAAGFKALVLTVDAPVVKLWRTTREPLTEWQPLIFPTSEDEHALDLSVTWKDIWWLKKESGLPVVVKGILTSEDTELAIQHGADAVYVSNHGGRTLDTVQATIDALPEVVAAARGRVEVYLDSGVRTGTDVLKALALGARAVFVGRPSIWGLVCKGQEGVHGVLSLLRDEFNQAMALSGCRSLSEINRSLIYNPKTIARL